ncbi:MAG TPA: kelch repeat-containing protein, partial [Actinomycetota bacterium]|nr:kelch repeat-containing protein [Actinomycetota bacterium]
MVQRIAGLVCLVILGGCAHSDGPSPAPIEPAGSSWSSGTDAPMGRTEVTATRLGRDVYVVGGFVPEGDETTARVDVYSIEDDEWSSGPDLPVAINHAMSATVAGRAYLIGGFRGPGLSNATRRAYVLSGDAWKAIRPMPARRAAGAAVGLDGRIYVVGGVTGDGLAPKTLVYNPRRDRWSRRPGLHVPRHHLGLARSGGKLYAVAGREQGGGNLDA